MMSLRTLEDVGALLLGPSFLTADPMGPLLDQDEEEALSPFSPLSSEGRAPPSPPLSFSSSSSSSSPSPPPSPPAAPCHPSFLGNKAGAELLSFPWLGAADLLDIHVGADDGGDDAFSGMDWMTEKMDLSDLDLDSLIGSCVSDDPPGSPEELLASLESHIDGLDRFGPAPHHPAPPPPEAVEVKTEPPSSPAATLPPTLALSPAYALELGSEVDVPDVCKISSPSTTSATAVVPEPDAGLLAPLVVVLAPEDEGALLLVPSAPAAPPSSSSASSDSESDSGIDSVSESPRRRPPSPSPSGSSRTKPYSKPPSSSSSPSSSFTLTPKVKSASSSGAPRVVEKKLKKMEQNKTAATRYRQKKRVEQGALAAECAELEQRNRELGERAESIGREIQYLRDLVEEVRSAKGRRGGGAKGGGGA